MAGLINTLIEILNEQASRYEDLLGLSLEKRDVIVANDIEGLQKITGLENILVSQNKKLEKRRIQAVADLAMVLNKKESELDLANLVDLLDGQTEQAELAAVRDRLRAALNELSYANAHNAELIGDALGYIDYSINVIRSNMQPGVFMEADGGIKQESKPKK